MKSNLETNLFIPRSEFQVFPVELPPLSRKEREKAAVNKLRGIYPATLEDKFIVIHPNGNRGAYLLMVFNENLKFDPLSISTLAAVKLCKKNNRNCIIACDGWLEYLVLEEGRVVSSMVYAIETNLVDQLTEQTEQWLGCTQSQEEEIPVKEKAAMAIEVFCLKSDIPSNTPVRNGDYIFYFNDIEKALLSHPRSSWSCFPKRLPQVKRRRRLFTFAACLALITATIFFQGWYKNREAEIAARREAERRSALEAEEIRAMEERLALLQLAWEEQLASQNIGVYASLEVLASSLSPAIRISSASIKEDGSFRLEASSTDAIAALLSLQGHPEINNAVIGTIVWDGSLEQFTVSGTVVKAPLMPRLNLSSLEKIAWYEKVLTNFTQYTNMPETAAAAAANVRGILERHRLIITRFRYLDTDIDNGWIIECSISGAGIQLVELLLEADTLDFLHITTLETRNRQNNIDAVVTFFVHGPGSEKFRKDYETHPSTARIAALYGTLPERFIVVPLDIPEPAISGLPPSTAVPALDSTPPVFNGSEVLEYVGFIGITDGRRYIYVKDTRSGELLRLVEGDGNYSYRVSNTGSIIALLGGNASPVEVRRNDGF